MSIDQSTIDTVIGQVVLDDRSAILTHNSDDIAHVEASCDEDRELIIDLRDEVRRSAERATNLEAALRTSRMIGAAVGIVMALRGVTESGGFEVLKKASQDSNRKLHVLAEEIVMTGDVAILLSQAAISSSTSPHPALG